MVGWESEKGMKGEREREAERDPLPDTLRVLVTDTAPLTPVRWGGPHRIFHLFSNLPERFDVTYVGLDLSSAEMRETLVAPRLREVVVPVTGLFPLVRRLQAFFLRDESFDMYSSVAASLDGNYNEAVLAEASEADILVASHPWGFPLLRRAEREARRRGRRPLLVYDAHNCELALTRRILAERPRLPAWLVRKAVERIEGAACRQSGLVLACSNRDAEEFLLLYGADEEKMQPLPNAVPLRRERTSMEKSHARLRLGIADDEKMLFFVGAYYRPNIEALEVILDLARALPRCRFHVAGSISQYEDVHPRSKPVPGNVVFHGVVDEDRLDDLLMAADIGLNPMFSGGGIQIKMLDYFAAALPVVSTSHGARGLGAEHGNHLIIVEPPQFAKEIERLLGDPGRCGRLGAAARALVEKEYSASLLGERLGSYLDEAWSLSHTKEEIS